MKAETRIVVVVFLALAVAIPAMAQDTVLKRRGMEPKTDATKAR